MNVLWRSLMSKNTVLCFKLRILIQRSWAIESYPNLKHNILATTNSHVCWLHYVPIIFYKQIQYLVPTKDTLYVLYMYGYSETCL